MSNNGPSLARASGMRGNAKPKSERLRRINIEIAKNGVSVSCDYDKRDGNGEVMFEPRIPTVFTTREALHGLIDAELDKARVLTSKESKADEAKDTDVEKA